MRLLGSKKKKKKKCGAVAANLAGVSAGGRHFIVPLTHIGGWKPPATTTWKGVNCLWFSLRKHLKAENKKKMFEVALQKKTLF